MIILSFELPHDTVFILTFMFVQTREPAPVIWIPQDPAGISEEMIKRASRYGRYVQYSNAGAYLTKQNKCEITRPAPDVRTDWLLDWVL